jgi:hypothetical protein
MPSLGLICDQCIEAIKHTHDYLELFDHLDVLVRSGKIDRLIKVLREEYYSGDWTNPSRTDYEIIREYVDFPFPMYAYSGE